MIALAHKGLAVLFSVSVMLTQSSCFHDSYWIKLSGFVQVGDQWTEFSPAPRLKAEKNLQYVVLDLEPPLREDIYDEGTGPNKGHGILMPDREVINPEIEVIDQYGNAFSFVWKGATEGMPIYGYVTQSNGMPRDREYQSVKIRSPRAIKVKAIYWFCESSKDWK